MKEIEYGNCKACLFFGNNLEGRKGYCKRYPPQPVGEGNISKYPIVYQDDWCGEYRNGETD